MATLFVRHPVANYPEWRRVYDSIAPMQKAGESLPTASIKRSTILTT